MSMVQTLLLASGFAVAMAAGYALAVMTTRRRDAGQPRVTSRSESIALMRRVGELSAVIDATREIEASAGTRKLCERLAIESESLAAADGAIVVLKRGGTLSIAAATDPVDRDDVALSTQAASWTSFFQEGGMPYLATDSAMIREGFGEGPLADRYEFAMEVPLIANGKLLGLVIVVRKRGSAMGFDTDSLKAVGLLADVASHLILLKRMNARVRGTNYRLRHSMSQLGRAHLQLVQTERLRAVGELVSGVAHEIANPLTALLGFAQLLTMNDNLQSQQRTWVAEIQREASRCSVILRNLLGFARVSAGGKGPGAPAAVVAETLSLKAYDLRKAHVEARSAVPESLATPALDRQELQQVLLNLISNAINAMGNATERSLVITGTQVGDEIVLEVRDSGCGIPASDLERIFEPFYSTKPANDSIGLGLTTCRKIVADRGGSVSVRSEVGVGSTFILRLPLARELAPA